MRCIAVGTIPAISSLSSASKARWLHNAWFTAASISLIHGTNLFIRGIVRLPFLLTNLYCTLNIYSLGCNFRFNLTYSIRQLPPSTVRYSLDLTNWFFKMFIYPSGFYVRRERFSRHKVFFVFKERSLGLSNAFSDGKFVVKAPRVTVCLTRIHSKRPSPRFWDISSDFWVFATLICFLERPT